MALSSSSLPFPQHHHRAPPPPPIVIIPSFHSSSLLLHLALELLLSSSFTLVVHVPVTRLLVIVVPLDVVILTTMETSLIYDSYVVASLFMFSAHTQKYTHT